MLLADALTDFFYARDFTPKSRKWYREMLLHFFAWLDGQDVRTIEAITIQQVRRYAADMRTTPGPRIGRPPSSATIHAHMRAVRAFLRWGVKEGLVDDALPARLEMPKQERHVLPAFTRAQVDALLTAAERQEDAALAARDNAILLTLLDTGVRANELCTLTLDRTVHRQDEAYLLVQGKGRKQREVGLGDASRRAVHRYVTRYRKAAPGVDTTFVSHTHGRPLTPMGLEKLLARLRDDAGAERFAGVRVSPHTFRHQFALLYMARPNADIYKLSLLMGHEDTTTTLRYLRAFQSRDARQGRSVVDEFFGRRPA
jgi:site-specific recombinase XerD